MARAGLTVRDPYIEAEKKDEIIIVVVAEKVRYHIFVVSGFGINESSFYLLYYMIPGAYKVMLTRRL